jgi:nucleotide-binding universal stress UspA family protein
MYRHILIPTDGSELAEHGVAHGLALAKSLGAKVFVIFVVEPFSEMTGRFLEAVARYAELRKEQATSVLDRAANAAKEAGFPARRFKWRTGNPIKPSSQQPRTKAAISLLCHRMGAADFPCF